MIDAFGQLGFGPPHHVGLVVPNLDEAMSDMANIGDWVSLGIRQPRVPEGDHGLRLIPETARVALKAAFSRAGPPHFELIEGVPGTIWSPADTAVLHHLAYWVPEERLDELSHDLEADGMALEVTRVNLAGTAVRAVYHRWRTGLRIELLSWGLPGQISRKGER